MNSLSIIFIPPQPHKKVNSSLALVKRVAISVKRVIVATRIEPEKQFVPGERTQLPVQIVAQLAPQV